MLLSDKTALIYGAGGAIGGAVARAFAREGARVFLAGRTLSKLDAVADEISAAGGMAETAVIDALEKHAVESHAAGIVRKAGRIDISFNAISMDDVQGIPLAEMLLDDFARPIGIGTRTMPVWGNLLRRAGASDVYLRNHCHSWARAEGVGHTRRRPKGVRLCRGRSERSRHAVVAEPGGQ